MEPKISVIIIGYNIQDYIKKCIESVLTQSFHSFEVIFVNDGSRDDTLQIASEFKNTISIIDKPNGGIISARKAGLAVAKGQYVTFVDGDDWINVDCLKNLFDPVSQNPDLDIVCSDYFYQELDGSFRKEHCSSLSAKYCSDYEFYEGIVLDRIDHHMFPKLYKKDFVMRAGYMDYPEVTMAEDWLANACFGLAKPKVYFSNTTNYFYRFNTGSVLRKGGKKILEQIVTLNSLEKFFEKNCPFDYRAHMDYMWFSYSRSSIK